MKLIDADKLKLSIDEHYCEYVVDSRGSYDTAVRSIVQRILDPLRQAIDSGEFDPPVDYEFALMDLRAGLRTVCNTSKCLLEQYDRKYTPDPPKGE